MSKEFYIQERAIGRSHPTYFIADLAANHDGDLNRAVDLIHLAAEAGADAAALDAVADSTDLSALSVYLSVTGGRA